MTATDIITKFRAIIDDTLDATLELQLLNDSMHEVEEEVQPEIIKKVNTSVSTTVGQTYTTAIALPTDIFLPPDVIYVDTTPYYQVPFDQQVLYRDIPERFYIDWANLQYHLTGILGVAKTITFPYWYTTTDLVAGTSPVWPARFHRIIPYRMAKLYYPIDQMQAIDSKSPEWRDEYTLALNRFKDWDAKLKLQAIGRQTPYGADYGNARAERINLD